MSTELDSELLASLVALVGDEGALDALYAHGHSSNWCAEPVHLSGHRYVVDASTGEIVESLVTAELEGGQYWKACGTRRSTRCPSCATLYKGDARQIVLRGLAGAKDVEQSVAEHPKVFATLTAPGFGAVHRRTHLDQPCHPGPKGCCEHGRARSCLFHHREDDAVVGEALCCDCYDYEAAVLFNASVSELWRRTAITTRRQLGRLVGLSARELDDTVRVSYVKVAEFQRRGVVHLHVLTRLDAADGGAPPRTLDAGQLCVALGLARVMVKLAYPAGRGAARWGEQFDCSPVEPQCSEQSGKVANYLAKYATKGSDDEGVLDRRIASEVDLEARALPPQLHAMVATAWRLGGDPELEDLNLRHWSHTLGLRSHFLTKSRGYSTTFKALRAAREAHQRAVGAERRDEPCTEQRELVVISEFEYAGRGWPGRAATYLAAGERDRAVEARRLARDELGEGGLP